MKRFTARRILLATLALVLLQPAFSSVAFGWVSGQAADDSFATAPALSPSPVADSLAVGTDEVDIYAVNLTRGTRISASMEASAGLDASLAVFDKRATDASPGSPVAYGTWGEYPRHLVFTAPADGKYYLVAGADSGTGNYRVTFVTGPAPAKTYEQVAGDNRYLTAIAAAEKAFPAGASTVIIATGENWPDALGGAALAGVRHAPILLTKSRALNSEVASEIRHLGATEAIVLGGASAVSTDVEAALGRITGSVNRLGGANRYDTADLIAREVQRVMGEGFGGECYIATGSNFPDALAASPLAASFGAPILLVSPKGLTSGTLNTLGAIHAGFATVLGSSAAVPESVRGALESRGVWTDRLEGDTRYETAAKVARSGWEYGLTYDRVAIATGQNFPDALAAGPMQAANGSVLLLTPTASLDAAPAAALKANKWEIDTVRFMGSTSALSTTARTSVKAALQ